LVVFAILLQKLIDGHEAAKRRGRATPSVSTVASRGGTPPQTPRSESNGNHQQPPAKLDFLNDDIAGVPAAANSSSVAAVQSTKPSPSCAEEGYAPPPVLKMSPIHRNRSEFCDAPSVATPDVSGIWSQPLPNNRGSPPRGAPGDSTLRPSVDTLSRERVCSSTLQSEALEKLEALSARLDELTQMPNDGVKMSVLETVSTEVQRIRSECERSGKDSAARWKMVERACYELKMKVFEGMNW
jgi:hypothetical protein